MKRAVIGILVAGFTVGGAYLGWRAWGSQAPADAALSVAVVQRGNLEDTVTATGTLQPRDYVDVGTQVSGQVRTLHVEIGDTVEKGRLLAEIDPTVYKARVDADEAQLRNQEAQLAERQAQLKLAEQKAQRQANMMREQATTAEAVQTAESDVQVARAQVQALRAQIQMTRSTLRGDQANLGYTKIYAPMAGTVVTQAAKEGQTLNANQSAPIVMRIADLSTMTVQTQVSEADVSRLRVGMPVYFTTLGDQSKRWYGKLRQVYPTPDVVNNVVLYNALFDVPNPEGGLMTQMTAQVFFIVADVKDATLVPFSALSRVSNGRATVRVVGADGRVEQRQVQVGVTNRVSAQIVAGLEPGERIATGERARPNARAASAAPTPKMGPRI